MKNLMVVVFLVFTTISFAQKPTNSVLNYTKSSDDFIFSNSSKLSLNMKPFELEDFIQNTDALTEFLKRSYNRSIKPTGNMPIISPHGKFFLEIYDVDQNIDLKLRIFDLEKSNYFWRSVG